MELIDKIHRNKTIEKNGTVFRTSSNTIALLFLIVGGLNLLLNLLNYTFAPASALAYDIFFSAIIIWLTVRGLKHVAESNRVTSVLSALLPVFAFLYILFSGATIERETDYSFVFHAFVAIICSVVLFFSYKRGTVIKIVFGIIHTVLFLFITFILFIAFMMADFGSNKVISTHMSPSSVYMVEIIASDQGALGGDTYVTVTRNNDVRNLLIGKLTKRIYSGRWGEFENMTLRWETDKILYINGQKYTIFVP
jgi:hypothetical protein